MGKKKARTYSTAKTKRKEENIICMNEINLKKAYIPVQFRTGKHMTEKDRPRKKNWKEYKTYM